MSIPEVLVFDAPLKYKTFADLATWVADELEQRGLVHSSWRDAVIAREATYPTGLALSRPVAIPHADAEHTLHDAFAVVRLASPLSFGVMGSSDATSLNVGLTVFIIAGKHHTQVDSLRGLISALADEPTRHILESAQTQEAAEQLRCMLA